MPATSIGVAAVSAQRAALAGGRPGLGAAPAHCNHHANAESGCETPVRDRLCPSRPPHWPFLVGHRRDANRSHGHVLHTATSSQT